MLKYITVFYRIFFAAVPNDAHVQLTLFTQKVFFLNKLASLEARLVWNFAQSLTSVECGATGVAKKSLLPFAFYMMVVFLFIVCWKLFEVLEVWSFGLQNMSNSKRAKSYSDNINLNGGKSVRRQHIFLCASFRAKSLFWSEFIIWQHQ